MSTFSELTAIVSTVTESVSYVKATVGEVTTDDGWIVCQSLLDDPGMLHDQVMATAAGRGTDDPAVAASLFVQAYAFRVASVPLAAWLMGLATPTLDPRHLAIRIGRHRPAELAITAPDIVDRSAATMHQELVDQHSAPLIANIRMRFTVGERLLWGNTAASLMTVARAIQSASGPLGNETIRKRADEFMAAGQHRWNGLGATFTVQAPPSPANPQAIGWFWERTNCCLWEKTEGGFRCDDCSLHNTSELREKRNEELQLSIQQAPQKDPL